MQGLEQYELGNGELIVNVTDHEDWSEVTKELGNTWTWEALQLQTEPGEDGEDPTEWLVLMNCKRVIACRPQEPEAA